jgi:hypothetical protein
VYRTIGFFPQVWLLTFKNLLITFKNPKNIIFLIITPFLLGTFLYFFQQLALDNGSILIPDPSSSPVPPYNYQSAKSPLWEALGRDLNMVLSYSSQRQY